MGDRRRERTDDHSEVELAEILRRTTEGSKLGFYWHFAIYVLMSIVFAAINFTLHPEILWFYWPVAGWGISVAMHFRQAFILGPRRVAKLIAMQKGET